MLKALILDWAGTAVDFGSRAPMGAFVEAFSRFGVTISIPEARGPMGLPKRDHVAALLASPDISARWQAAHGAAPTEADIDAVLAVFEPLERRGDPAPCRPDPRPSGGDRRGPRARHEDRLHHGLYPPDHGEADAARRRGRLRAGQCGVRRRPRRGAAVAADDVPHLRRYRRVAALCLREARRHRARHRRGAGRRHLDRRPRALRQQRRLSRARSWRRCRAEELAAVRAQAAEKLFRVGAHFVIDSVADLLPVLDAIEARLAAGMRP